MKVISKDLEMPNRQPSLLAHMQQSVELFSYIVVVSKKMHSSVKKQVQTYVK